MAIVFSPTESGSACDAGSPSSKVDQSTVAADKTTLLGTWLKWRGSRQYDTWLKAQTLEERDENGPPETSGLNLQGADLTFEDLRGAKLSERFRGGKNLNLDTASDLRGAHLTGANLQRARLRGVRLEGADLEEANLTDSDLCFAHLDRAKLTRTNLSRAALAHVSGLQDARLQDSNFEDATGLTGTEFERADLTGARLPATIRDFSILTSVNDVSSNAQKTFLTMLLVCLYCWLTIATTSDAALLANSSASPLPVIQTPVPIAGFYWAAPLLLFAIFIWFHIYLQDMWLGLAGLPAIFPDGTPLDQKVNPWLLTGFICPHFKLLRSRARQRPLSKVKVGLSVVLAWWLMPLTLVALWLRYLPRHDWPVTVFHAVMIVIALGVAGWLQYVAGRTLRGRNDRRRLPMATLVAAGAIVILAIALVSDGAINGMRISDITTLSVNQWPHRIVVPRILPYLRARAFADLSEASVSSRPENWFLAPRGEPLEAVRGATLRRANLHHATAQGAFLAKALLHDANLEFANLRGANLEQADLRGARLKGAILVEANLRGADLTDADVNAAQLASACGDEHTKTTIGMTRPPQCESTISGK